MTRPKLALACFRATSSTVRLWLKPLAEAFAPTFVGRIEKRVPFDSAKAEILCDQLDTAIDEFIEAANTELAQ